MRTLAALLLLLAGAGLAAAETVVGLGRAVSDRNFYRAVACAAKSDSPCREPLVKWGTRSRTDLRVALMPPDPGYPAARARLVAQSVPVALDQINAAGSGLRLRQVAPDQRPHIRLYRSALRAGDVTRGTPGLPDGDRLGVGHVRVWWNADRVLDRATILITADVAHGDIRSVVLEELVQSLGQLHDVAGPGYARTSIFDNDSNTVTRLAGQDLTTLRLHYPPP